MDFLNKVVCYHCLSIYKLSYGEDNGDADCFVGRADGNQLKLTKYHGNRCSTIIVWVGVKRHDRWCGVGKKDQIGCHVTTESVIGY